MRINEGLVIKNRQPNLRMQALFKCFSDALDDSLEFLINAIVSDYYGTEFDNSGTLSLVELLKEYKDLSKGSPSKLDKHLKSLKESKKVLTYDDIEYYSQEDILNIQLIEKAINKIEELYELKCNNEKILDIYTLFKCKIKDTSIVHLIEALNLVYPNYFSIPIIKTDCIIDRKDFENKTLEKYVDEHEDLFRINFFIFVIENENLDNLEIDKIPCNSFMVDYEEKIDTLDSLASIDLYLGIYFMSNLRKLLSRAVRKLEKEGAKS